MQDILAQKRIKKRNFRSPDYTLANITMTWKGSKFHHEQTGQNRVTSMRERTGDNLFVFLKLTIKPAIAAVCLRIMVAARVFFYSAILTSNTSSSVQCLDSSLTHSNFCSLSITITTHNTHTLKFSYVSKMRLEKCLTIENVGGVVIRIEW